MSDHLTPQLDQAEQAALERAARLDAGENAEALADKAHHVAYVSTTTAQDLRELAALCLIAARRSAPSAGPA